jgi:hypothetical protein
LIADRNAAEFAIQAIVDFLAPVLDTATTSIFQAGRSGDFACVAVDAALCIATGTVFR